MELLTGNLLIASTLAEDPVYSRGVCLIVHQDERQVIGVMLNRPMQPDPGAFMELLKSSETEDRLPSPASQTP
ncbi:MAG: YqgE/AlgH family protein, partial [Pirellulales bacterium]|nr:YqgE/AlgH family protein [Pirellulales bacterium]